MAWAVGRRAVLVGLVVGAKVEIIGVKACEMFSIWSLLKHYVVVVSPGTLKDAACEWYGHNQL